MRRLVPALVVLALPSLAAVAEAQYIAPGASPLYGSGTVAGTPLFLSGTAMGPVDLSAVDSACRGYASAQPSHVVNFSGGMLRLTTEADGDTTFLVRLPDGRMFCDDDGGDGFNPLVEVSTAPGRVEVWVGSYGGSPIPYRLVANGAAAAPAVPSGGGMFANVTIGPGMPDPVVVSGAFGGPVPASSISSGCAGHVSPNPSHLVTVTSYLSNLRFVVNGDADTTLLVQWPDGRFSCNDDGGGYPHPLVEGGTPPGTIRVWVGAYSSGGSGSYALAVTTNPAVSASDMTGGSPPPPPPPVVVGPPPVVSPPYAGGSIVIPAGAARVDLDPRIPVTLFGSGVSPTVAIWSPRGGPSIEVATSPRGSMVSIAVSVNGVVQSVVEVPAALAASAIVTVTERADRRLLVRAERPPGASDPGETMLWLLSYTSGAVAVAESWAGSASERGPRWSR
jgi:hypothetical protein